MHGFALAFLGFAVIPERIALPSDVEEVPTHRFAMQLRLDPVRETKIEHVRLFVSRDQGKTWNHCGDYAPGDADTTFRATRDGLYYFALQVKFKDGTLEPVKENALIPARKVYVNTARKPLKFQKSNQELQREIEELKATVGRLRNRIKELESDWRIW